MNRRQPMLLIGRFPAREGERLRGQYRVSLNLTRYLPVPVRSVTLWKEGGWLPRLFALQTRRKETYGVSFEEVSLLRLCGLLASYGTVFVAAGYYYGFLACLAKMVTLGNKRILHRTGGFTREEYAITRSLGEERGTNLLQVGLEYVVLRTVDTIVVNSNSYAQRLVAVYPFCRERVRILPNGIDHDLRPAGAGLEAASQGRNPGVELLSVSNLFGKKGIDRLLEAYLALELEMPSRLTLVGDGLESLKSRVEEAAATLRERGDNREIRLLACVGNDELREIYRNSDVYVQLSRLDEGPSAVLEAYCHGLPLVLSESVGVHPEIETSPQTVRCSGDARSAARLMRDAALRRGEHPRVLPRIESLQWKTILQEARPWLSGYEEGDPESKAVIREPKGVVPSCRDGFLR